MPTLTERFLADIEGLSDLPSLSPVLAQLIATLGRDDASVSEVAAIIVRRLALVASLYDAVPVRGTRAAREVFWQHSLGVAHGSEIIARHATTGPDDTDPEGCFLAGLLHDIGLLVLDSHYPKESAAVKKHAEAHHMPLCQAEMAVLSTDHGEFGALLTAHWSMPEPITAAIRAHHRPQQAPAEYRWHASVVHLADSIVSHDGVGDLQEGSVAAFEESVFDVLGLPREELTQIVEETRTEARRAASVLSN